MSLTNKILLSGLASVFMLVAICDANAARRRERANDTSEEGSIIFRIENIKPLENNEGIIDSCSFVLTAFNRMDKPVKEAVLNLTWKDEVSDKYYVEGEEIKVKDKENATTEIELPMTINSIAPHSQKSFEGKVKTNRCYLLFDNLEYKVESCVNEGEKLEMKDGRVVGGARGCAGNFNYINTKNPEYYTEFKDVPESVIARQAEEEKANELAKINDHFQGVMLHLENTNKILGDIK